MEYKRIYWKSCQLRCVVFDVDDTIVDTINLGYIKINEVARNLNLQSITYEQYIKNYGKISFEKCIASWFPNIKVDSFIREYKEVSLKRGFRALCDFSAIQQRFKQNNIKVAICTNAIREEKLFKKLDAANTDYRLLECIITGSDVEKPKPSGNGLELVSKKLNIKREDIIYVGDSYYDYLASQDFGCGFIAVNSGWDNWEGKKNVLMLSSIVELLDIIQ